MGKLNIYIKEFEIFDHQNIHTENKISNDGHFIYILQAEFGI